MNENLSILHYVHLLFLAKRLVYKSKDLNNKKCINLLIIENDPDFLCS